MDPLLISKTPYHAFCEERELPICKRSIIGKRLRRNVGSGAVNASSTTPFSSFTSYGTELMRPSLLFTYHWSTSDRFYKRNDEHGQTLRRRGEQALT
ncbi:hypothetical protein RRG08_003423 [Elysia crispata]|uniref:Uncharacterized protein n=1 Tax=Elysia crispata TaxID=231223 RepID=A0AAE1ABS1_9GAST|nr:hypothetical protein RRG08_003423 [Elysia crispata]